MRAVIVPAVIPMSAEHVRQTCRTLAFSPEYHLDVVDGVFVPTVSWPIKPAGVPAEVSATTDHFTLEVDLMVIDPLPQAVAWENAGADMIVFHIETITSAELAAFANRSRASIGVSLHGDTPMTAVESYLPYIDYVQLMAIATIGQQGLPFDPHVLDKITWLREVSPNLFISVDGSMNRDTIPLVYAAGANRFICGSSVIGQSNPARAYQELLTCIPA